jgi:hypothetical protein
MKSAAMAEKSPGQAGSYNPQRTSVTPYEELSENYRDLEGGALSPPKS